MSCSREHQEHNESSISRLHEEHEEGTFMVQCGLRKIVATKFRRNRERNIHIVPDLVREYVSGAQERK